MATNEFKAFATAGGANVLSQEEYLALAALSTGFQSGIAKSAEINKALRQATTGVAALTQFISEATDSDINDNGDVSALVDKLAAALAARGLSRENPFADIAADGTENQALANLGLGEGSALPVGVPVPWPGETAPEGWLKCNGAAFDTAKYPKLALAYPSGKLPDLRGEFIRGWDDGRGVDSGRSLLSIQNYAFEDHALNLPTGMGLAGVELGSTEKDIYAAFADSMKYIGTVNSNGGWTDGSQPKIYLRSDGMPVGNNNGLASTIDAPYSFIRTYKASTGWNNPGLNTPKTANETRPRNVAFNYIVRAS